MGTIEITNENFEKEILKSDKLAVVDFHANWCGPCKTLGPVIDKLSEEREDVVVGKLNVDSNSDLAQKYRVRSIPTVIFMKDGEEVSRMAGANSIDAYNKQIDSLK